MYVEGRTVTTDPMGDPEFESFTASSAEKQDPDSIQKLQPSARKLVSFQNSNELKKIPPDKALAMALARTSGKAPGKACGKAHDVIVLSYHDLSVKRINPSIITPVQSFANMLKSFDAKRYETFFASDIGGLMEGRVPVKQGFTPLIITFDDGYRNNYSLLLPLLKKFKAKATFFLITSKIKDSRTDPQSNALIWPELVEIAASGYVELGSHTHNNHKNLVQFLHQKHTIPEKRKRLYGIYKDLRLSRNILEKRLGIKVVSLAWPHGKEDKHLIYAAKKAGFKQVFNTRYGINRHHNKSLYRLRRISASSPWLTSEALLQRMSQAALGKEYCFVKGQ